MTSAALELLIQLKDEASAGLGAIGGGLTNIGTLALGGAAVAAGAVAGVGVAALDMASSVNQAANDMQAQLGLTAEEAQSLAAVAQDVWANNWGTSIDDVSASLTTVVQNLSAVGVASEAELNRATSAALALRDSFGVEVAESTDAAATLMQQFGLSSQEAFDFITKGMQEGLNRSGDFLETIGEYSTQFSAGGATAAEFFSLLDSGLQGGVLGTDKAADAFKEFRVRIQDGSTATSAGLQQLGIDADLLAQQMASGQVTAADAFQLVLGKLNETDDANIRMQAGVALLGTQFEDLGTQGALALSLTGTSLNDLAGATDSLNAKYQNWGSLWEGFKRQALDALMPAASAALQLANEAMPAIMAVLPSVTASFAAIASTISDWVQSFAEGGISGLLNNIIYSFTGITGAGAPLITMFQSLIGAAQPLIDIIGANLTPILVGLAAVIGGGIVVALGSMVAALVAAAAPIVALVAVAGALYAAWSSNFLGIRDVVTGALSAVLSVVQAIAGQIVAFWQANGTQILATVTQVWGQLQTIIGGALQIVMTVVQTVYGGIATFIQTHSATIQAVLSAAWGAISAIVTNALNIIQNVIRTVLAIVKGDWGGAWEGLKATVAAVWNGIGAVIKAGIALIGAALKLIGSVISEVGKNVLSIALDVGRSIINGIISGVKAAGSALFGALKDMAKGALDAAKSALGIASPSKVMAQEIGAPIVDGIVAGLVQRSPKAVQAMLDLASSMFDVVNKGVEAFGKLTQLGTIPQSAILNFSDAIQRTLTEFAERMRAWDKAAMSAASQFTYKAGQVVEFLTKGVELLTGIANLAMPSQGAISAFADAMAWVMREIARVSTFELRLGLTAAVEFAAGAKAVLETISIGVTALNSLADFVKPAPGVITQFTNVIYWLVSRFVLVGQAFAGQALGAAAAFAQAAGQVFAVVASGVEAILKLAEFVKPAPGVITTFSNVLYWLVSRFVAVAQAISGPALTAAATFADGAGKVIGIIGAGVDGLLKLGEFVRPAPGVIQTFANVVYWLVSRFVEVAAAIGQRGVAAAATFADGAGKVLAVLKSGVEGLNALNTLAAPTYEAMAAFSMAVDQVVALLAMAAEDVGQKATDAAAKFAEGAGKVLGILKSGVEGLNAIDGLIQPSYDALAAFSMAVDQIVWLMSMAAEDVSQKATDAAAKFAEGAGKVLGILKSGVEGLNALGTLVVPTYEAMGQFSLAVDQIVWFMYMAAEDVSLKATEAAAKFAEGAGKVLSMVGAGVDALSKLVEFVAPAEANVSAFFRSLADLLEKMGTWAADFDAKAFEVTGAFAAGVQKSVAGIGAAADALGKLVEFVAPAQKNVSAFFFALADLLEKMGTWAGDFDTRLLETTAAFANGVNASVAPLKGAIESLGKFTDFVPPAQKGVSAFFVSVGALLTQMGVLAGQYSAEFFAGTILFGQNIAKSVESIKAAFAQMAGLADLKGIASGVLTSFTSSLTALLGELERQVAPTAENIGAALVFGIADGIQAQIPYLVATLQNAAYTMVDTVQTALGIASPSKVFEQIGQYAGQGMVGGMAAMQPALAGAGAGLGMAAVDGAGAAVSGRAGGGGGDVIVNIGTGAFTLNGVQGGIGEKELRRLAQLIKEEIANERGTRG